MIILVIGMCPMYYGYVRTFQNASQFNQDLSSWDMSSAKSIRKMFLVSSFSQIYQIGMYLPLKI